MINCGDGGGIKGKARGIMGRGGAGGFGGSGVRSLVERMMEWGRCGLSC